MKSENSSVNPFMQAALDEAYEGIRHHHGGPFGSVVVKNGVIVGRGHNMVLVNHDSTAHGEISAIRDAERNLSTHSLEGCELYTTGEPCPMCLAACRWANLKHVYYGCTIEDNALAGFRDQQMDKEFGGREAFRDFLIPLDRGACRELFEEYRKTDHVTY